MTFQIHELPSGGLLFKGNLIQKKLTSKSRRQLILCFVYSVQDIAILFDYLKYPNFDGDGGYSLEHTEQTTQHDMEIYGHLSLAAVNGLPLLIVGTQARTYVHFSQVSALYDEQELGSACSFSISTPNLDYKFYAETSFDYQK